MNYFPSNKTIVITFLVLVTWFGIKFVNKANDLFFQLNYNWNEKEIIKEYGEVTLDSVTYNFLSIYLDKNIQLNPLITYKLHNNDSYYFRYTYALTKNNNYRFFGVEWITETPSSENKTYSFSEINLPLNQKDGVSMITLGDQYLITNEAKYFRKFLAQNNSFFFKGTYNDVFNYPHEAINKNTSIKIISQLENIEPADTFVLFFGAEDNLTSAKEIKKNIEIIINKLRVEKKAKKIIFITLPPSKIDVVNKHNIDYNKIIEELAEVSNVIILDSYALFKDDIEKYIRKDGISLSKDAYYLLAKKVSEK